MANQMGFNGRATVNETKQEKSSAELIPGQSGVYSNVGPTRTLVLPQAWEDDGDDEITAVWALKAPEIARQPIVPSPAIRQPKQASWQVAMVLHGDELTRLWTQESESMAGRMFVWSDYSKSWVPLHCPSEIHPLATQARSNDWGWQADQAPLPAAAPVDLTSEAHSLKRSLTREHAGWLAAAAMALTLLATLLVRTKSSEDTARSLASKSLVAPVAQALLGATPAAQTPPLGGEILSVDSLPLVDDSHASTPRAPKTRHATARSTTRTHSKAARQSPVSTAQTTRTFDASLARLAIQRAVGRARQCAPGAMSGTALVAFQSSGFVKSVTISGLSGSGSNAQCVAAAFRSARVTPFKGGDVVVKKSFRFTGN